MTTYFLALGSGLKEADAFQRLVFVNPTSGDFGLGASLKEADAFQRLVSHQNPTPLPTQSRLKEADAFQRLVLVDMRGRTRGRFPNASKKQTPFSVWYVGVGYVVRLQKRASKKQTPFSVWYSPRRRQRSRCSRGLKEADAFQRLVYLESPLKAVAALRASKKQTPFRAANRQQLTTSRAALRASKKQTPFSVWYGAVVVRRRPRLSRLKEADAFQRLVFVVVERRRLRGRRASKKQTPFSVWYNPDRDGGAPTLGGLKEADAFQRLVFDSGASGCLASCQPQRSRRLSASGIPAPRPDGLCRRVASKKQTPFSVWYLQASAIALWAQVGLKEADAFQRLVSMVVAAAPLRFFSGLKEADAFQRLVCVQVADFACGY